MVFPALNLYLVRGFPIKTTVCQRVILFIHFYMKVSWRVLFFRAAIWSLRSLPQLSLEERQSHGLAAGAGKASRGPAVSFACLCGRFQKPFLMDDVQSNDNLLCRVLHKSHQLAVQILQLASMDGKSYPSYFPTLSASAILRTISPEIKMQ